MIVINRRTGEVIQARLRVSDCGRATEVVRVDTGEPIFAGAWRILDARISEIETLPGGTGPESIWDFL